MERSSILDDAFNLAQATELDYKTALDLTKYMTDEMHYFPWRTTTVAFSYISHMMYGHQDYYRLRVSQMWPMFLT